VDNALREAGFTVVDLDFKPIGSAAELWTPVYFEEILASDAQLVADNPGDVGEDITGMIGMSPAFTADVAAVRVQLMEWRESIGRLFDQVELLALPTLPIFPPRLDAITPDTLVSMAIEITGHVTPFNAAGTPCTAQPIRTEGSAIPASLQLVGPLGGEELLLTTAQKVEAAAAPR
jgi:Asp-tRNA(Asn)/Glu-tRNA(Gln) amidotransferase A subunit family amidase